MISAGVDAPDAKVKGVSRLNLRILKNTCVRATFLTRPLTLKLGRRLSVNL